MRQINKAAIDLIVEFEGCKLEAYKDAVGVWTIGIGHTAMAGPPNVTPGMKITQDQAYEIFKTDVAKYAKAVEESLTVQVNDNQFGAMTSLCYNVGPGNFKKSSVLKKTNAQDWLGAANAFAMWNKAGGRVLNGLTRRRKAEANLYLAKVVSQPVVPEPPKVTVIEKTDLPIPLPEPKKKSFWAWLFSRA